MTIEEWNEWLWKEKGINVQMYYNEYLISKELNKRTLREFLEFVSIVSFIPYQVLTARNKVRGRNGSNKVSRARGYVVKAILLNKPDLFSLKKIYSKVFGFNLDHSTAIHHRDITYFGEELEMYKKIENYIKTYDIQWEH
jgi:hypothetical protein